MHCGVQDLKHGSQDGAEVNSSLAAPRYSKGKATEWSETYILSPTDWTAGACAVHVPTTGAPHNCTNISWLNTVWPLNIQTTTFFISVLKQDPAQQHATKKCPGVDKSKAIATLPSDHASDIVRRLCTAPSIGKGLYVCMKLYGMKCLYEAVMYYSSAETAGKLWFLPVFFPKIRLNIFGILWS